MKNLLHYIFVVLLSSIFATQAQAQDEAIFQHYILNPTLLNPAFAGANGGHDLFLHARHHFAGFEDAPRSYALSYNGAVGNNVGLGAMLLSDNVASLNRIRGAISYSYQYRGENWKGGAGFTTEFNQNRLNGDVNNSPFYDQNDRSVADAQNGIVYFDASLGAYATFNEKFTVSLATPNLIKARLNKFDNQSGIEDPYFLRQFIFMAGYKYDIEDKKMSIEPSVVVRRPYQAPLEADVNIKANFLDEKFMAGLMYRPSTSGAVGFLVGTKQDKFRFAYMYSASLAQISTYTRSSHELTLGLSLEKKEVKRIDRKNDTKDVKGNKRYKN